MLNYFLRNIFLFQNLNNLKKILIFLQSFILFIDYVKYILIKIYNFSYKYFFVSDFCLNMI